MICVYASNTTDFENNGLTVLDKYIKSTVTEEVNGEYSLTLIYPLADENKSKYLIKNNVIKTNKPNKKDEYFRIEKTRRTESTIEVLCYQISKDLDRNFLEDVRPANLNGHNALNWMADRLQYPTLFTFGSDIDTVSSASYFRKNFLDAVMGSDDNSFLKRWGGELDRNKFSFRIVNRLGSDRGFRIERGKNLIEIEEQIEGTETTRIMPTGRDENDKVIMLPEKYVDSPLINNYPTPSIKTVDFSDVKVSRPDAETDYPNLEAVYTELRRQANLMYSVQNVDRPKINFNVKISDNSKLKEYKKLGILQTLFLGDTVTIYSEKLNLDIKARLLKYEYDCATDKYINLEFGDFVKSSYSASAILNNTVIEHKKENSDIANKIKRALGGHVLTREGELLIMDTEDIATMLQNWRWNLNGLAYGEEGYWGNYQTAITMDGEIVADFIKTGTLIADLIKAGVLKSANGKTWINMEDGTFNFVDKITFDGTQFKIRLSNGDDLENKLAEVTQTAENVKFSFSQSGGSNLIRNGNLTKDRTNCWSLNNGAGIYTGGTNNGCIGIYKHSNTEGFLESDTFQVKGGQTYSFSCYSYAEINTLGGEIFLIGSANNDRAYTFVQSLAQISAGQEVYPRITFTVPNDIKYAWIRLDTNGASSYSGGFVCWYKDLVLIEGKIPSDTFIRNANEIYEGNTTIDKNGVTISNGALTVRNSNGNTTIDASKLMLRILMHGNGALTIPNGSTSASVTIPHGLGYSPIFRGQFRYLKSDGMVETYSDSMNMFEWGTGVMTYNGRMFVDDNNLYILISRTEAYRNSGSQTIYTRWFIEEGVNL